MKTISLLFLVLSIGTLEAEAQGSRRYETEVFATYQLQSNIPFGQSITAGGSTKTLLLDVYMPAGDTATNRPLVVFIHGGGFKGGDKVSNFGTRVCGGLARRGYVVASIEYRVSSSLTTIAQEFEAMVRAVQDAKASVRFFRRYASQYGVDTTQVFVTGSSAGSITALHMAYLEDAEIPSYVNMASLGSLEGSSGNPGYSSAVQGVISNWGALADFRWMKAGDPPVYCVHGVADTVVPYDSSFADGPFKYGSTIVHANAQTLGIPAGLRLFAGTGHTLDNSAVKQDSAIKDFSAWLFSILKQIPTGLPARVENPLPENPFLHGNFPNPFNPATTIEFFLPSAHHVHLGVYDTFGRLVSLILDAWAEPGMHRLVFDAARFASGVYYCRLRTAGRTETGRMLLVR